MRRIRRGSTSPLTAVMAATTIAFIPLPATAAPALDAGRSAGAVDTRDWDHTLGMNNPGQSGDPDSPLYDNLFELWANDRVFPVFFSREKIEGVAFRWIELRPE